MRDCRKGPHTQLWPKQTQNTCSVLSHIDKCAKEKEKQNTNIDVNKLYICIVYTNLIHFEI